MPWRDLASYDDSGATGHRFAWVLPAGTYTFHLGADVRSARPIGAVEIANTRVLRRLEQAAAPDPDHPFQRMTRRTGLDGAGVVGWEPVPVSEVDLRERILSRLPAALPAPTSTADGAAPSFASVLDGTMSPEDFVALLEPDDLASCGAKLPVIASIAGFCMGGAWWAAPACYLVGIVLVIVSCIILKKMKFT